MTQRKHFKQLVRERMKQTGQRYAAARRLVLLAADAPRTAHRPGLVPGATALRVLLAHTGLSLSEPMVFGLAGGIGIGQFSFFYEKEDFASFFVAGRHCWHDELTYFTRAAGRLQRKLVLREASTPKAGVRALRELLDAHGPCIAWVDLALLPHRGLQHLQATGGGYHVITVYSVDEAAGTAQIGDLTDEPITIALADLSAARARNRKDKQRLAALTETAKPADLRRQVQEALAACARGLTGADAPKNARRNFSLDVLTAWAERLTATTGKDRWEHVYAPGHRAFNGLLYLHHFIEHFGTGGGLSRPLMAEFLRQAGSALRQPALGRLAEHYARLGEQWSDLAAAALPDEVAPLAEARARLTACAELFHSGGSPAELAACWREIQAIEQRVHGRFPLTPVQYARLREELRERVLALHAGEVAAHEQLAVVLGG